MIILVATLSDLPINRQPPPKRDWRPYINSLKAQVEECEVRVAQLKAKAKADETYARAVAPGAPLEAQEDAAEALADAAEALADAKVIWVDAMEAWAAAVEAWAAEVDAWADESEMDPAAWLGG
ncbi:unnamed protein product [Adineta steineri]|uniref:Uncharacterized protein n=1 Tax=Adineta steineri TaxID=433720 RepID=A0A818QN25_9BILA|nr:unnamed protein product [Adineta steineri]